MRKLLLLAMFVLVASALGFSTPRPAEADGNCVLYCATNSCGYTCCYRECCGRICFDLDCAPPPPCDQ